MSSVDYAFCVVVYDFLFFFRFFVFFYRVWLHLEVYSVSFVGELVGFLDGAYHVESEFLYDVVCYLFELVEVFLFFGHGFLLSSVILSSQLCEVP